MSSCPAISIARSMAVMVRVRGPDPKGRKMRRHAFFNSESGTTALSSSGLLLEQLDSWQNPDQRFSNADTVPGGSGAGTTTAFVVTDGSIMQSFSRQAKAAGHQPVGSIEGAPQLIPGAEIHVLAEEMSTSDGESSTETATAGAWHPGTLVALVDVTAANTAVQALLAAHSSSGGLGWELGWALAPAENHLQQQQQQKQQQGPPKPQLSYPPSSLGPRQIRGAGLAGPQRSYGKAPYLIPRITSNSAEAMVAADTAAVPLVQLAIVRVQLSEKSASCRRLLEALEHQRQLRDKFQVPRWLAADERLKRGDYLAAVGSPFGILSPHHFLNSVTKGVLANQWSPHGTPPPILMADLRCLPGMEGGPVLNERGSIVGLLSRPLRQQATGAEVQLVITAHALLEALGSTSALVQSPSVPPGSTSRIGPSHVSQSYRAEANRSQSSRPRSAILGTPDTDTASRQTSHPHPPHKSQTFQLHPSHGSTAELQGRSVSLERTSSRSTSTPSSAQSEECHQTGPFRGTDSVSCPPWKDVSTAIEAAAASVVLITVGDASWASGVVLNRDGLILTNAHLVEPWRFHKSLAQPPEASIDGLGRRTTSAEQTGRWGFTEEQIRRGTTPVEQIQRWTTPDEEIGLGTQPEVPAQRWTTSQDHKSQCTVNPEACSVPATSSSPSSPSSPSSLETLMERTDSGSCRRPVFLVEEEEASPSFQRSRSHTTATSIGSHFATSGLSTEEVCASAPTALGDSPASYPSTQSIPCPSDSPHRNPSSTSHPAVEMALTSKYPHRNRHRIRVRVDQLDRADSADRADDKWHDADIVFVSQGPLDVALLKLREPLAGLRPIVPEMETSELGSTAVVIGHGLFGPRSALQPSVSAGVVSRVVMAPALPEHAASSHGAKQPGRRREEVSVGLGLGLGLGLRPALIQTTAAVHAGGSGGAVVNHRGHMLSLVTSNAKHNGWAVLPHLNFSVPCAALAPIFRFAASSAPDRASLLADLNRQDKELATIWALVPPPPPPTPPVLLPPVKRVEGDAVNMPMQKGARFATFFADAVPKFLEKGPGLNRSRDQKMGQSSGPLVAERTRVVSGDRGNGAPMIRGRKAVQARCRL